MSPAYWRMQLHPNDADNAFHHSIACLSAGLIGVDFSIAADLMTLEKTEVEQSDAWHFAHEMAVDDVVLVMAHHYPLALCRVASDYNYIRRREFALGEVWFRHFRRIDRVYYYGDFVTNAHDWARITMTNTLSPLRSSDSQSRKLIDEWLADLAE